MADTHGFLKYKRQLPDHEPPKKRLRHYKEFVQPQSKEALNEQAARCMDCGIPFCQSGCPLGNIIPEFNDAVYREEWYEAYQLLSATNNFPEFTGRICPAPCEASCVLGLENAPVTIEYIEKSIVERAFKEGWVKPFVPDVRTGKSVAVIGSGPSGLAAAEQLNRKGHSVCVYERSDRIGGLLRYGIPDFKLEKWIVDRRIEMMQRSGITFRTNAYIGKDISGSELLNKHDALLLTGGSTIPRDLNVEGRGYPGIHFAMEYLEQSNRRVAGDMVDTSELISAKDKHVVVIGGGDTGSDCVGTANRQGAASVTQIELLAQPPAKRDPSTPWPLWPMQLRTSSSHEEGCDRQWAIMTKAFEGTQQGVTGLRIVDIDWQQDAAGKPKLTEKADSSRVIPCDLVLFAMGFLHGERKGLLDELGLEIDQRGNVRCNGHQTNVPQVFSAGDMRMGQSLVVTAIADGRKAAEQMHTFLQEKAG